jgi:hypothetical protein
VATLQNPIVACRAHDRDPEPRPNLRRPGIALLHPVASPLPVADRGGRGELPLLSPYNVFVRT